MSVKLALKYNDRDVEAMKAIAQASKTRLSANLQQVCFEMLAETSQENLEIHVHKYRH